MDYAATCGVRHVEDAPREARHSEGLLVLAQKNYHKARGSFFHQEGILSAPALSFPPHMHIPPYT